MTQAYNKLFYLPNVLTLVRIFIVPLMVVLYYLPVHWAHHAAAAVFALAGFTDWLDGYLARYLKQSTRLGAFLDPVADKLIVSITLVILVAEPSLRLSIPTPLITIPAAIIVAREIIVSALREWMAEVGERASVAVSKIGKFKTCVQMLALVVLLYCSKTTYSGFVVFGYILLYAAAILTVWSMVLYLKAAGPQLLK